MYVLVRLEFEIKLEPLLLSCPTPTAPTPAAPVLETPNLVHTLGGLYKHLKKINFLVRLELLPVLNGLT